MPSRSPKRSHKRSRSHSPKRSHKRSHSPKRSKKRSHSRSPKHSKGDKIYCLLCKKKTASKDAKLTKDRRGKPRVAAKCAVCGTKKFKYVPRH